MVSRKHHSLSTTFSVEMPGIDPLEAEAAQQMDGGGVVGGSLGLDDGEELVLQIAQDLHEQEFSQSLAAHLLADDEITDADGVLVPALAVGLHLPHERVSGGLSRPLVLQAILVHLDGAEDALLPPSRPLQGAGVNLIVRAKSGETAVGDGQRLLQGTLE